MLDALVGVAAGAVALVDDARRARLRGSTTNRQFPERLRQGRIFRIEQIVRIERRFQRAHYLHRIRAVLTHHEFLLAEPDPVLAVQVPSMASAR